MEKAAWHIRAYEPQLIPGLLQTEAYSTAVLSLCEFPIEQVERLAGLRKERQNRFRDDTLWLWVILDESALRRPAAGARVQLEQLRYLRAACYCRTLTLQVLPHDPSSLPFPTGFSFMRYDEPDLPDVVYVEHLSSALYLDEQDDVDDYVIAWQRLCLTAHPPDETLKLLDQVIAELGTAQDA